jgi:BatD DUF11 like domain
VRLKKTGSLLILLWIAAGTNLLAGPPPVTLKAVTDSKAVYLFDRISYRLEVEGSSRNLPEPRIQLPEGLKVEGVPRSSSQVQWINGKWSSSMTYQYTLKAVKEGSWTIPPATVVQKRQTFRSNSIRVKVLKPQASGGTTGEGDTKIPRNKLNDLFLWAEVDQSDPYLGQAITVTYDVYTRLQVVDYDVQQSPAFTGFWAEVVPRPQNPHVSTRTIQGVEYAVATIHTVELYPTVTGDLIIEPLIMGLTIESKNRNPMDDFFGRGSAFRSPFMNFNRKESRSSQTLSIHVKPLPVEGKPVDFTGAVGDFKLDSSLDKHAVQAGDALILTLQLAGKHVLKTLPPPSMPILPNFKAFDPKAGDVTDFPDIPDWNVRKFELILVPHRPGDYTLPPVTYSYFNPADAQYHTLTTGEHQVHINPAPGMEYATMIAPSGNGSIQLIGHEIRYIKTQVDIIPFTPPYTHLWFLLLAALPIPGVPFILFYGRHRKKLSGDQAYARAFKAKGEFQDHFRMAKSALTKGSYDMVVDSVANGFASYLGNRMNLPTAGLTLEMISDELANRDVPAALMESIKTYWEQLETIRFAPGNPGREQIESLVNSGFDLISSMEKLKMKQTQHSREKGYQS